MRMFRSFYYYLAVVVGVLALAQGCSTTTYYPPRDTRYPPPVIEQGTQAPVEQRLPVPAPLPPISSPIPQPPPVSRPQPPAVVALLDTAEQQANNGDLEAAAASLERAIRIDPRNPLLWYHLATVRLSQGDARSAEQLAVKSNSLASGNTVQQRRNWKLIVRARRSENDAAGMREAEQRVRELR